MKTILLGAALLLGVAANQTEASTLDFSGAIQGINPNPLVLANATLTNLSSGGIFAGSGALGQVDGFCFQSPGLLCAADGKIEFLSAVTGLTFDIDGWENPDAVTISAFFGNQLLGSFNVTGNGPVNAFASFVLTSLMFDDTGSGSFGVGYSTFLFNETSAAAVPVPAGLPLLASGLGALGFAGWRRNQKSKITT